MFSIYIKNYNTLLSKNLTLDEETLDGTYNNRKFLVFNEEVKGFSRLLDVGILVLTVIPTFGLALFFHPIQDLWQAARYGNVKHYIDITTIPESIHKISKISRGLLNEQKELFKGGLLTHSQPTHLTFNLNIQLDKQQQADLELAYRQVGTQIPKDAPYSIEVGGEHRIIFLKSLPNVVFKVPKTLEINAQTKQDEKEKQKIDAELKLFKEAFETVKEKGWNRLRIPSCCKYVLDNQEICFLVQEKLDVEGDFNFQKGLYRFAFEQSDLQPFMKDCFSQLAQFICATEFSDVKYNNIPFLLNGTGIGLYDLDKRGGVIGLFEGEAKRGHHGLLNYAPTIEFLNELVDVIRQAFTDPKRRKEFEERWKDNKEQITNRIEKRALKRAEMKKFLETSGIEGTRQLIDPKKISYSKDPKISRIQKIIIPAINKELIDSQNFDLIHSRRAAINLRELWGKNKKLKELYVADFLMYDDVSKALEELKQQGVVHAHKHVPYYHYSVVRC